MYGYGECQQPSVVNPKERKFKFKNYFRVRKILFGFGIEKEVIEALEPFVSDSDDNELSGETRKLTSN